MRRGVKQVDQLRDVLEPLQKDGGERSGRLRAVAGRDLLRDLLRHSVLPLVARELGEDAAERQLRRRRRDVREKVSRRPLRAASALRRRTRPGALLRHRLRRTAGVAVAVGAVAAPGRAVEVAADVPARRRRRRAAPGHGGAVAVGTLAALLVAGGDLEGAGVGLDDAEAQALQRSRGLHRVGVRDEAVLVRTLSALVAEKLEVDDASELVERAAQASDGDARVRLEEELEQGRGAGAVGAVGGAAAVVHALRVLHHHGRGRGRVHHVALGRHGRAVRDALRRHGRAAVRRLRELGLHAELAGEGLHALLAGLRLRDEELGVGEGFVRLAVEDLDGRAGGVRVGEGDEGELAALAVHLDALRLDRAELLELLSQRRVVDSVAQVLHVQVREHLRHLALALRAAREHAHHERLGGALDGRVVERGDRPVRELLRLERAVGVAQRGARGRVAGDLHGGDRADRAEVRRDVALGPRRGDAGDVQVAETELARLGVGDDGTEADGLALQGRVGQGGQRARGLLRGREGDVREGAAGAGVLAQAHVGDGARGREEGAQVGLRDVGGQVADVNARGRRHLWKRERDGRKRARGEKKSGGGDFFFEKSSESERGVFDDRSMKYRYCSFY
eukprot:Rhum_TRINITY_DN10519_c0_g2::Rhum_TRINITY_DN10519_c0_g2_i1::g.38934::m.38934